MSERPAISLRGAGKMYKLFGSRGSHLVDSLGLRRLLPGSSTGYKEFWALRGIDLELAKGHRIGIVGRNGAGKSTLLKLITGNIAPTEGHVLVNGEVRALIDAGGGFHPEFTGRENIRSALIYQGFKQSHIRTVEEEIGEFTELGDFLDQPFKTYSLGMQTRLTFATATAIRPDILVIDEMLGAGDGYFISKSTERMRHLVRGGATVLLVTHSLDQVMMFCEEAIWIDRGRVVERGASLDVCKAYEKHLKVLDDRRLRAKNLKVVSGKYQTLHYDDYGDNLVVQFNVGPAAGSGSGALDISIVDLVKENHLEERLLVGDAQDVETSLPSFVITDKCQWSGPAEADGRRYRRVAAAGQRAIGQTVNYLYAYFPEAEYAVDITYRTEGTPDAEVLVIKGGETIASHRLPPTLGWTTVRVTLPAIRNPPKGQDEAGEEPLEESIVATGPVAEAAQPGAVDVEPPAHRGTEEHPPEDADVEGTGVAAEGNVISRWPGEGSMLIDRVRLLDDDGADRAVYHVGEPLKIRLDCSVRRAGRRPVIPVAVMFRRDGVLVSKFIGNVRELDLPADAAFTATLDLGRLNLGDGYYVFSVALYRSLDVQNIEPVAVYDLIDRSYEFQVYGTPPLVTGIFQHRGEWRIETSRRVAQGQPS